MKKNKAIAIFCLLFIILIVFATCTSMYLNKNKLDTSNILARVDSQGGGGGSAIYKISLENLSLLTNVKSCENSTRTLIKAQSATGESKNVYACVTNDLNNTGITNCDANYIPTVAQIVYGVNNNDSAFARFCQKEDINSANQGNESTGNSNETDNQTQTDSEDGGITGGGADSGTVLVGDRPPRLVYDNICASEGFRTASKIAGIIILVAKWLAPLLLMIYGMIDFGKAVISGSDKALSDATTTFIKRIVIAIIIPIIPGLLFYLVNFFVGNMKDGNGEPILDKDGNFRYCTDCLNYPLDSNKCSVKLYDYKDQTSAE